MVHPTKYNKRCFRQCIHEQVQTEKLNQKLTSTKVKYEDVNLYITHSFAFVIRFSL